MRMLKFGLVLAALGLSACGGSKILSKSLPDETRVVDGPTLALPPQFELRPPRESSDYESLLRAQKSEEARSLITGTSATTVMQDGSAEAAVPAADAWLVEKTSAQTGVVADPSVRKDLVEVTPEELKAREDAKAKRGIIGRWFGRDNDE